MVDGKEIIPKKIDKFAKLSIFFGIISFPSTLLLVLAILCSCGYHVGQGEGLPCRYNSLSIPYVVGDEDGAITYALVKEVVRSGAFEYRNNGGALILYVEKVDEYEENIGFRYDRKKRGKLTKDTIPTEGRLTMVVEVSVVEAASCCTVLGPVRLSASIDYDHDYYSSRDGVNIFSLGQLSDLDEAYDAAQAPLNRVAALKVVDYITQSW